MSLYTKPSRELVYDLINQANPDLPYPVAASNISLGAPAVVTGAGSEINTEVIGRARPNSQYIGNKTFRYRRLVFGTIFRGMTVEIHKYSEALNGNTSSGTVMFTIHQLLADLNAKFGLNLAADDVTNGNITRGNTQNAQGRYTTTVTVNAAGTSMGWTGSFQLRWVEAPRGVDSMINIVDLNGRAFPGGNDFEAEHPAVLNSVAYGTDWTEAALEFWKPAWSNFPSAFTAQATSTSSSGRNFFNEVIRQLKAQYPTELAGLPDDSAGVSNARWTQEMVALPNAKYPEANSTDYNYLLILTPHSSNVGVAGSLLIHFSA